MAASDQTYRNQKSLHLVFAISSVAMLVSTIWMFWDDYNRPFKKVQRDFRTVEAEVAKRTLLASAPTPDRREAVVQAEKEVAQAREIQNAVRRLADDDVKALKTKQFKAEKARADKKAEYDSLMSFYNIEIEHKGPETHEAQAYQKEMTRLTEPLAQLQREIEEAQAEIGTINAKRYTVQAGGETVEISPKEADDRLSRAEDKHKKLTEEFDRFAKLAAQKTWKWDDWVRTLPVLDAFASPVKIQQYTLDELPIDYSFKYVTRYDRCATCHLGLEKSSYDKETLTKLTQDPASDTELQRNLDNAKEAVKERNRIIEAYNKTASGKDRKDLLPVSDRDLQPRRIGLSSSEIAMYAAHPRLDLFVDVNSPHPAEKFGCSSCHGGQGSATTFQDATHAPNDVLTQQRWAKDHHWEKVHFWDFPMLPQRFAESGCVKCHHQINSLIRDGNQVEAPKLVKGYNLVRELGCFGCHEIYGLKNGRPIGPDLRLEPDPPLESLSPEERAKRLSDPANPPGTFRKVGPSLNRVAEKTSEEWIRQWVKLPRGFRPDTRMPHYYEQPNNRAEVLPDQQRKFPDAEVTAIAHYLIQSSKDLVRQIGERSKEGEDARQADAKAVEELTNQMMVSGLGDAEKRDITRKLAEVKARIAARALPGPVEDLVQLPPAPADDKAKAEQLERGRHLFSTRGCLACHQHDGTSQDQQVEGKPPLPAIVGESEFGPNLSRLTSKLGTKYGEPQTARKWLVQWLLNPTVHSPRTRMPSVQLTPDDANDIAAWLLAQPSDWKGTPVERPSTDTLKALARVWLEKSLTRSEIKQALDEGQGFSAEMLANRPADADERYLEGKIEGPEGDAKLMMYVGKKAINNYGCFGCHTIPNFETAKPIGTGLNDWGKKDPERLAFEDSVHFVEEHFHIVDARRDLTDAEKQKGAIPWEFKDGKAPYERFYFNAIEHHPRQREGFLHLKLQEPRSYDFNRIRTWEERLRMPQFKFARVKQRPGESAEDYALRVSKEEAEAREAVMTFILGLVAEQVPAKYLDAPSGDRLAQIKGRDVLDQFNCAGCHLVQPGAYDFKLTGRVEREEDKDGQKVKSQVPVKDVVLGKLEELFGSLGVDPNEYRDPVHSAWAGVPQKRSDRLRAHGTTRPEGRYINDDGDKIGPDEKNLLFRLARALHFTNLKGEARDLPASVELIMPREATELAFDPLGGAFATALAKYLQARDPQFYGGANANKSFAAGPPSLFFEGEKVQPGWLFQFLLSPYQIRPLAVLRMPKFNLSDHDAQTLVNYFAAANKATNPGIGLTYPYLTVPEREEAYLHAKTAEYVERLKKANAYDARVKEMQPVWARILKDEAAAAEVRLKTARARLDEAKKKNEGVDIAEKAVAAADEEQRKLKAAADTNDSKDLQRRWEQREAYVVDAFKLASDGNLCLQCHQVGTIPAKEQQGPSLALASERLRPEYTRRWITNPQRFLHYQTIMPINFKANAKENEALFLGSEQTFSLDQIKAARDLLMIYPQVVDWPVLKYRQNPGDTGGQ